MTGSTGRAGQGIVLNWDDRSLSGIGIPGRIGKFQVGASSIGGGDDGLSSFKQGFKNWNLYGNIQPFSQVKNKWISGLTFEAGTWFGNINARVAQANPTGGGNTVNGCQRFRIRDHGDGGRQTLIDSGLMRKGWVYVRGWGISYNVGPNTLRFAGTVEGAQDRGGPTGTSATSRANKRSRGWLIGDDLYLWSPKGFLTGSSTTPGSILVDTHFERAQINIDCTNKTTTATPGSINCAQTNIGGSITQFHRNTVLLREWDLWYFLAPRMSAGINILCTMRITSITALARPAITSDSAARTPRQILPIVEAASAATGSTYFSTGDTRSNNRFSHIRRIQYG